MKLHLGVGAWSTDMRTHEPLTLLVATYNMGERPPSDDLSDWLGECAGHSIVAIGVQEGMYEPKYARTSCEADIAAALHGHLGEEYALLCAVSMLAIRLYVFVKAARAHAVSHLQVCERVCVRERARVSVRVCECASE